MKQESATNAQVLEAGRGISRDLAAAAAKSGELLQDLGTQTLQSARETLGGVRETLEEARTDLRAQARGVGTRVQDYVDAHPWRVIGAAAAAGIAAGVLLGRR